MALPWPCHFTAMQLPWCCPGSAIALPQHCHGSAGSATPMPLQYIMLTKHQAYVNNMIHHKHTAPFASIPSSWSVDNVVVWLQPHLVMFGALIMLWFTNVDRCAIRTAFHTMLWFGSSCFVKCYNQSALLSSGRCLVFHTMSGQSGVHNQGSIFA